MPPDYRPAAVEVRRLADQFADAILRRDAERLMTTYDEGDRVSHTRGDGVHEGREAVGALFRAAFDQVSAIEDFAWDEPRIAALSHDAAIFTAAFRETLVDRAGRRTPVRGAFTMVVARRDDGWRILHSHSSHAK